nr:nonstructural protein NS5A [Norway rat hepacivirus 2]
DGSTIRGRLHDIAEALGRFMRFIVESVRGLIARGLPRPILPLMGCDKSYKGPWMGSGPVRSTCGCGLEGTWMISEGKARQVAVSKRCKAYWTGGVPINNTTQAGPTPAPMGWETMVIRVGYDDYRQYHRKDGEVWLMAVSHQDCYVKPDAPLLENAVVVDGVQIVPTAGDGWKQCGTYKVRVLEGDKVTEVKPPFKLSDYKIVEDKGHPSEDQKARLAAFITTAEGYASTLRKLNQLDKQDVVSETSSMADYAIRRKRADIKRKALGSEGGLGKKAADDLPPLPKKEELVVTSEMWHAARGVRERLARSFPTKEAISPTCFDTLKGPVPKECFVTFGAPASTESVRSIAKTPQEPDDQKSAGDLSPAPLIQGRPAPVEKTKPSPQTLVVADVHRRSATPSVAPSANSVQSGVGSDSWETMDSEELCSDSWLNKCHTTTARPANPGWSSC